jgi:hypothetical protein
MVLTKYKTAIMKKIILFTCTMASIAIIFNGCASNEIGNSKDVTPETIYQGYDITYKEGEENVKVFAQFRFAGENGTTLVLSKPSSIAFDSQVLTVDSSEVAGAFYQALYPVAGFYGKHQFTFTDINLKKVQQAFSFENFKLTSLPAIAYKNQALQIPFDAAVLGADDYLEINSENSDSTFSFTHTSLDTSHFIQIPAKELQRQKGDNLSISITLFKKIPLQNPTKEGGFIMIEYYLKPVTIKLENIVPVAFHNPTQPLNPHPQPKSSTLNSKP